MLNNKRYSTSVVKSEEGYQVQVGSVDKTIQSQIKKV